jgi:protein-histidine pros-kinase
VLLDQVEGERQLLQETVEDTFSHYECIYRRKDGSMLYVSSSSKVLTDSQTEKKFIVSGKTDITRQNLGHEMQQLSDKFGGLLESMPDAIIMTNLTGHIVLTNSLAEKLFGYQKGELLGQSLEFLIPERFRGGHAHQRNSYFAKPRIRSIGTGLNLYGLRKDGTEFPAEISLSPLTPENSTIAVSAIRDISERKKASG